MKMLKSLILFCLLLGYFTGYGMSLKEAYDLAGPAEGYDKYLELETGQVYTGGLLIGRV